MSFTFVLRKMSTALCQDNKVHYSLKSEEQAIELNSFLGKELELQFTGNIYCVNCSRKIKKTYQGRLLLSLYYKSCLH